MSISSGSLDYAVHKDGIALTQVGIFKSKGSAQEEKVPHDRGIEYRVISDRRIHPLFIFFKAHSVIISEEEEI